MERSFFFGIGIGIFLVIALVTTRNGLKINQNDFVMEENSDDQKEAASMIENIELMNRSKKLQGKRFENLSPTLSEGTCETIWVWIIF